MERHTIIIETSGAAFEDAPASEVARILREMADDMEKDGMLSRPRDSNGNDCGYVYTHQL